MTGDAVDAGGHASYGRSVGSRRPSLLTVLVTLVAGCVLGAGGFAFGKRSGETAAPASVPLRSAAPAKGVEPIVLPSSVDLPRR